MSVIYFAATFLILYLIGLPIYARVSSPKGALGKNLIKTKETSVFATPALIPVIGFAALTTVLAVVTLLGVPIKYSAWPVLVLFLLVFILFAVRKKKNIAAYLPSKVYWAGLLVVVVACGVGYFASNPQYYRASDTIDLVNYFGSAQRYLEYPVGYEPEYFGSEPWLRLFYSGVIYRYDITFFYAFISKILFMPNVTPVFGVNVILSGAFMHGVAHMIAERLDLPKGIKNVLPVWAACVPGLSLLILDGFIPSSISVSFSILWGIMIYDLAKQPTLKRAIVAAMLLACITSMYTEMLFMFAGITAVVLVLAMFQKQITIKGGLFAALLSFGGSFLINIQQYYTYTRTLNPAWSLQFGRELEAVYARYMNTAGLTRLFFGAYNDFPYRSVEFLLGFLGIALLIAAVIGLGLLVFNEKQAWPIALLAIAVFPIVFISDPQDIQIYRFYRTLSQAAPAFIIGIGYLIGCIVKKANVKWLKKLLTAGAAAFTAISVVCCGLMTLGAGNSNEYWPTYTGADYAYWEKMEAMDGESIYLVGEPSEVNVSLLWGLIDADGSDIWFANAVKDDPMRVNFFPRQAPDGAVAGYYNYAAMPDDCVIVYAANAYRVVQDDSLAQNVAAVMVDAADVGVSFDDASLESPLYMKVYSNVEQTVTLSLTASAEFSADGKITIANEAIEFRAGETIEIPLQIKKGMEYIPIEMSGGVVLGEWKII